MKVKNNDMLEKEKRIIVLTGASRGIGHATVKKFQEKEFEKISKLINLILSREEKFF